MTTRTTPRTDRRRFRYDPLTGPYVLGAVVLAAIVLGVLALTNQGSPRMDDRAAREQGVTIPNPTALDPARTTGSAAN